MISRPSHPLNFGNSKFRNFELRGGPIFGPVQNIEVNSNFSSNLMIMWSNPAFGPFSKGSKTRFWSYSNKWKWTKSGIRRVYDHVTKVRLGPPSLVRTGPKARFWTIWRWTKRISKWNSNGPKAKRHAYVSRDYLLHILNCVENWYNLYNFRYRLHYFWQREHRRLKSCDRIMWWIRKYFRSLVFL